MTRYTRTIEAQSRRDVLLVALGVGVSVVATSAGTPGPPEITAADQHPEGWPAFPWQSPEVVREFVGASHGNIARVRELLGQHPELAKSAVDWGFGDWESALGAASHVGRREIAELLIEHGARPDLFCMAMLGETASLRALIDARPALAALRGPHGISLLAHAQAGGHEATIAYVSTLAAAAGPAPAALTEEEAAPYVGTFRPRSAAPGVALTTTRFGLTITADVPGAAGRTLLRTGEHQFHPVGAPGVRVSFRVHGARADRVEVVQGPWFYEAARTS